MGLKKDKLWYKYEKLYVLPKQKLSCVGISLKMDIRGGSGVTIYYRILYPQPNRKSVKTWYWNSYYEVMNIWKNIYVNCCEWRIIWRKIIAVIYAIFAVAKRKLEKNSGLYGIRTLLLRYRCSALSIKLTSQLKKIQACTLYRYRRGQGFESIQYNTMFFILRG